MKSYFSKSSLGAGLGAFAAAALSGCAAPRINHSALLTPLEPAPVKAEALPAPSPPPPATASPKPIKHEVIEAGALLPPALPNILIYHAGPGYVVPVKNDKPFLPPQLILPPGTLFYLPDHIPLSCINADPDEDPILARIVWLLSPTFDDIEEHIGIIAGGQSSSAPPQQTSFQARILPLTPEKKLLALEKHLSFLQAMADSSPISSRPTIVWRNALLTSAQRAITVHEIDHMTLRVTWENIGIAMAPSAARHALKKWEEVREKLEKERASHPAAQEEKADKTPAPFLAAPALLDLQPRLEDIFNPKPKER